MVKKKESTASVEAAIDLPQIELGRTTIRLTGDSSLIMHQWSEKAKKEMLDKQMKVAKSAKEAKDPEADYRACIYHHPDGGHGFPSIAFKNAAVDACRFTDGVKMTVARGAFHVDSEFVKIEGEPNIREDMVRVGMGTADIRYRAEFRTWTALVPIVFNIKVLSLEQIVNLFNLAGFGVGVGEWRPEKNGQFGRFHVAREGA